MANLLRWEGLVINRKRTYRLYKAKNLAVDHRRRRRPPERERLRLVAPERRNQRWSMDFASDALWTRRRFRCLCIVDDGTRESPALLADFSIAGAGHRGPNFGGRPRSTAYSGRNAAEPPV